MTGTNELPTNIARTIVKINNMTTQESARAVRDRLLEMDGVLSVRMNITDPSARVEYLPSKLSPTHIGAAIGAMGFSTTVRSTQRTM